MEKVLNPAFGHIGEKPSATILGLGYNLLISSQATGGQFELMRFVVPKGIGPPTHCHRHEDECFYILEGQFEATLGDESIPLSAGGYLHLPKLIPHGIRNTGASTGSFLCWVTPGNLGPFFERITRPLTEGALPPMLTQNEIKLLTDAAGDFGIELFIDKPD